MGTSSVAKIPGACSCGRLLFMPDRRPAARNFQDLLAWQKAHALVLAIYQLTGAFPKQETYGLGSEHRPRYRSKYCRRLERENLRDSECIEAYRPQWLRSSAPRSVAACRRFRSSNIQFSGDTRHLRTQRENHRVAVSW